MLNNNISNLRKQKGMSQEELAIRLNVVRQTVSKWEQGLSVPDATMLIKLAEELEVSVGALLGATISGDATKDEVANQLARINEQLAIKNKRSKTIWKVVLGIVIGIIVINIILVATGAISFNSFKTNTKVQIDNVEKIN